MLPILLFVAVSFLAFANGANDNFKGVATLYGSKRLGYRPALIWATLTTLAGSLTALLLGSYLLATFSGKGIVPQELVGSTGFVIPVAIAAAATVLLATRYGFPISTTHSLIGGLLGSGLVLAGSDVSLGVLGQKVLLPLLASPVIAALLTWIFYGGMRRLRERLGITEREVICVQSSLAKTPQVDIDATVPHAARVSPTAAGEATTASITEATRSCSLEGCVVGVEAQTLLDAGHVLSAGALGFARGLNDTPKIMALLLIGSFLSQEVATVWIAIAMAVGGLLASRRVAKTISHDITPMNEGQGFSANFISAILVLFASKFGMPVSTTHVSVGAIFGLGAATGEARRDAILSIVLAWVVTLPLAAAIAAASALLLS